ncbi:MAG TPA: sterol desaturase family protein [Polyangiales bacterium]|jgi:sterol desaturase/sphingolipid hydroxylase (fatty acid hydroxylase superfamily)
MVIAFGLTLQQLGLATIVVCALLFILLERRFPCDREQALFRPGFFVDLIGYGLVQSYLLGLAISWAIAAIDRQTELSHLQLMAAWPLWLQCLFFLVVHDLYIYLFHRAQHENRYLWRIHEAHHSGRDVDWLSGTRSHALEILVNQTIEFAPIVLLGAAPEVALFKGVIDAVWGMYIHANIGVCTGLFQRVLNGPEMHRLHHARGLPYPGVNFATKLAIWDWMFGTSYLPERQSCEYGLDGAVDFPTQFVQQQWFAFRPQRPDPAEERRAEAFFPAADGGE